MSQGGDARAYWHCGWLEYYQSKIRVSCIMHKDTSKSNRDTNRDARELSAPPGIYSVSNK